MTKRPRRESDTIIRWLKEELKEDRRCVPASFESTRSFEKVVFEWGLKTQSNECVCIFVSCACDHACVCVCLRACVFILLYICFSCMSAVCVLACLCVYVGVCMLVCVCFIYMSVFPVYVWLCVSVCFSCVCLTV